MKSKDDIIKYIIREYTHKLFTCHLCGAFDRSKYAIQEHLKEHSKKELIEFVKSEKEARR